jgi:1,4-dihydroxy-2-naphthoyl-CoA hydrolase
VKAIFAPEITLKEIQAGSKGTLSETLGLEFVEIGADFVKGALTVDSRHLRPGGIVNGGVYLAMIETVASVAARCAIHGKAKNSLGIQVNANHLKVAVPGDRLTATARPIHLGKSTHLWDVAIENQNGKLVSRGTITLLIVM